jgi:hypothetical protein
MTHTVNLALPCIDAAQAQKHVTHNEALRILDTLVQLAVLDRDLAAPPGLPVEGQRWIVAASPAGAWSGHASHIAAWQDGAWMFSVPAIGWLVYVIDEGRLLAWNGTAWADALSTLTTLQNIALLGVGTTADAGNPFSAKLNNALWVAKTVAEGGDGNLRYKLSKESASKTLSFLLQDNFSGRAEFGLTSDDDFHFKVSANGSAWVDALRLDKTTGLMTHADGVVPRTLCVQRSGDVNDSSSGSGAYRNYNLTYTIPANFLCAGRALRVTAVIRYATGSAPPVFSHRLLAGSTVLAEIPSGTPAASVANRSAGYIFLVQATAAPGSAVNVETSPAGQTNAINGGNTSNNTAQPVALATNGALTLTFATQWATAGTGTNTATLSQFIVEALN